MTTKNEKPIKKDKISHDMAEHDFERFADFWDVDTDVEHMTVEDRDSFETEKRRIIRSIISGRTRINDEGNVEYTMREAVGSYEQMIFKIPRGEAYISMDKHKERQSMHKIYSVVSSMTGVPSVIISRMHGNDSKFAVGMAILFLAS